MMVMEVVGQGKDVREKREVGVKNIGQTV